MSTTVGKQFLSRIQRLLRYGANNLFEKLNNETFERSCLHTKNFGPCEIKIIGAWSDALVTL